MKIMDQSYCETLENEALYLLRTAARQRTRQDILTLLRNRAEHWRSQRGLATRPQNRVTHQKG